MRRGDVWWLWLSVCVVLGCTEALTGDGLGDGGEPGGEGDGGAGAGGGGGGDGGGDGDGDGGGDGGGDGDGDGGGDGGGDGDGDGDGDTACGPRPVSATRAQPEFLILLDRSGSMGGADHPACMMMAVDCADPANAFLPQCLGIGAMVDRWTPTVGALGSFTASLDATLAFGLSMYPTDGECGAGSVEVGIGIGASAAIQAVLDATCPAGRTPAAAALLSARDFYAARAVGGDPLIAPYVLLLTDGAPNCIDGGGAEAETLGALDALVTAGVRTYVLGYDTAADATLAAFLDQAARHGGTGDAAHHAVADEAGLVAALEAVAIDAATCTYALGEKITRPEELRVRIDGAEQPYDTDDGWRLGADGASITLVGGACDTLVAGGAHRVDAILECAPANP